MTASDEGVRPANVRSMWPHEAHDFTPWLARHLDLLGAELGLTLEKVGQEVAVGPYFLDILARTGEDGAALVAIENQLEWSDLHHLGQLIAYATGLDARVAVWVAPEFRRQLALALHRLNEWTVDGISFHAVRVEVVSREGSEELDPRFRKVVWPGGWDSNATVPDGEQSEQARGYEDFFRPLTESLVRAGLASGARQLFGNVDRFFTPAIGESTGYAASLERDGAWVTLHIRTDDRERTKRIFDALHADRAGIEAEFEASPAPEWHWFRHNAYDFSSINIRRDGAIHDPPETLDEVRRWMLDGLREFRAIFDARVRALLDREGAGGTD